MKTSYVLILAIVVLSCGKSDPTPTATNQLLVNADMESGNFSVPSVWIPSVPNNFIAAWSSEASSSSSHSLKLSANTADPVNISYWSQSIQGAIPFGKDLILSVKVKANLSGTGAAIAIRTDQATQSTATSQFSTTQSITPISGTFDWTTYQVKLTNVQSLAKTIYVFFIFEPNTTGTIYFDDATLTYDTTPPPGPVQVLLNNDMETGSFPAPNNWWYSASGNYTASWSTDQASSASHSLKITTSTSDPTNFALWSQVYQGPIPTGKDVTLTAKVKTSLVGTGVTLAIRGDDTSTPSGPGEQFITTEGVTSITGNSDWTTYTVKLTSVQTNIKSLTVYLMLIQNTTGTVYFDDVSLTY